MRWLRLTRGDPEYYLQVAMVICYSAYRLSDDEEEFISFIKYHTNAHSLKLVLHAWYVDFLPQIVDFKTIKGVQQSDMPCVLCNRFKDFLKSYQLHEIFFIEAIKAILGGGEVSLKNVKKLYQDDDDCNKRCDLLRMIMGAFGRCTLDVQRIKLLRIVCAAELKEQQSLNYFINDVKRKRSFINGAKQIDRYIWQDQKALQAFLDEYGDNDQKEQWFNKEAVDSVKYDVVNGLSYRNVSRYAQASVTDIYDNVLQGLQDKLIENKLTNAGHTAALELLKLKEGNPEYYLQVSLMYCYVGCYLQSDKNEFIKFIKDPKTTADDLKLVFHAFYVGFCRYVGFKIIHGLNPYEMPYILSCRFKDFLTLNSEQRKFFIRAIKAILGSDGVAQLQNNDNKQPEAMDPARGDLLRMIMGAFDVCFCDGEEKKVSAAILIRLLKIVCAAKLENKKSLQGFINDVKRKRRSGGYASKKHIWQSPQSLKVFLSGYDDDGDLIGGEKYKLEKQQQAEKRKKYYYVVVFVVEAFASWYS